MAFKFPNSVIMVFCKAPVAGQVKTRLIPALSGQQAAELHAKLALRVIGLAAQSQLCPVQLWCYPSLEHNFFKFAAQELGVSLHQQMGSDLGEKMLNAFRAALTEFVSGIIIGCDCPSLLMSDFHEALTSLMQQNTCVLAPAEDGGYVLIGLNAALPELFTGISWGSDSVFRQTRARIDLLDLNYVELKQQWDIDTSADLKRYLAGNMVS